MRSDKYQNKYRTTTVRLQNWDYRSSGAYFITICTKDRECLFGEVENGKIKLSNLGAIANVLWFEIKNHQSNVEIDEFIVMPNHIHGILILKQDPNNDDVIQKVEAFQETSLPITPNKNEFMSEISPKSGSISTIIRSYKSAVTKHANRLQMSFAWQSGFYDHVIRDEYALERIRNYIRENPGRWKN